MRYSAKLLLLPIVSLLFGVAASSQANEALFSKSSRTLEQLWSGILNCHDPAGANAGFTLRNRFDSEWDIPSVLDEPERRDYAACARRSLRNNSSRMLAETIEDGIRHGGVALLGERFRLDSSVSWVWGESVRGEINAVIPVWDKERSDGTGSALFMQHGATLWNGLESDERIDANFGLVYRSNLNADTVAGGSFFYDHDFKRGHKRLGAGVDVQSGIMHFAVNYYHPTSNWRKGRENHEEQALQGADFSLGFLLDRVRLNSTLGVWRYEDSIEQGKDDWRPSFDVEGGFQVLPGVFLKGGYEYHKGRNSPGSRWHAGLAFRFSLPGFEGAKIKSESTVAPRPSLWQTVRREKRILYEERVKVIPSVVSIDTVATIEEGGDPLTMTFTFNKPLEREVTVVLAPTSDSTTKPGDYTLIAQVTVTPPISRVGEELSTGAQTESSQGRIEIILPQHTTSLNITLVANDDETRETDKLVKLTAYTTGENAQYARFDGVMQVTIPHNDDFIIGFADAFSSVEEDAGTAYLLLQLGRTAPAGGLTLSVDATGSTGDIAFASPASVTVPEGTPEGQVAQSVASIAVDIIDDNETEADETVTFTISEGPGFPASPWRLEPDATTHTLTILASDQPKGDVGFAPGNPASANEGEAITLTVMSSATADADLPVTWTATPVDKVQTATGTVIIENGSDSQTFSLDINDDASESAGSITITLAAPDLPNGWSLGAPTHTIAIIDNDPSGFVRIASASLEATLTEPSEITVDVIATNSENLAAATSETDILLEVELTVTGDPDISAPEFRNDPQSEGDYTVGNFFIDYETGMGSFIFTVEDDDIPEGREIVTLALKDPHENLPDGWLISDATSHFTVTIPANDNAVRFSEWPRNNPGNFAGLSASVEEGEENGLPYFNILIDHIAPEGGLPLLVSVPDEYAGDIDLELLDQERAEWNSANNNFLFLRNGNVRRTPNIAAGLRLRAVNDDEPELEETFDITLMELPGFPSGWGGVTNAADTGTPAVATSTNFSVTIPASDNTVSFTDSASSATEDAGTHNVPVRIERAFPEPVTLTVATGGTANGETDYNVNSQIVIPADSATANVVVTLISDEVFETDEYIDLTISGTLPEGWSFGGNTHRITITNDDSGGVVEFTSSDLQATLSEPDTITIDVSVTNRAGFIAATSANVELDVEMTAVGDPDIVPAHRNDPESANDYTVGSLLINHETGTGSFTFTAEDDNIPEGREIITLALADPDGNLPDEWNIDDTRSRFTVTVPGNDNAARFAEWPRNNPGSFTGLSLTLEERANSRVAETNFTVLIDHIAPSGNLPFLLSVPDEHRNDIGFRTSAYYRANWDFSNKVFTFLRSGNTFGTPNIAAGLEIFAVADDVPEREETFEITLMEGPGWPGEWGSVANIPDIVNPALATATTLSVTIPANGNTVSFADPASSAIEDAGTHNVPVRIEHTLPEPITLEVTTGGTATKGIDYMVESQIVIPANSATADVSVTLIPDSAAEFDETIELFISGTLPNGWSFGNVPHRLTILDDDSGGVVEITNDPLHATLAESDTITIDVALTNSADFMTATPSNVELDVEMTAVGDPDVVPAHRNDPKSANDYTIENLVIDRETGTGSFTFTVEDDDIAEGKEIITLTIKDPDGRLPYGWVISGTKSEFTVTVPGNDNALRFSEWPRNDPGSFAELSATVAEGETGNFNILIDHIAPEGDLSFFFSESNEAFREYTIIPTDYSRIRTFKGGEIVFIRNGNINQEPNLAVGFEIRVSEDDEPELEETFDIKIIEFRDWPDEWGSVMNAPDIGTPAVATSSTFSLTIPASDNTVFFSESESRTAESLGTHNVPIHIHHPLPEPVTLAVTAEGSATRGIDYTVDSQIVIPADNDSVNIAVTLISDSVVETNEYIDLTIGGTLPSGWSFDNTTHRITILDGEPKGLVEIVNTSPSATLTEPSEITVDVIVTNSENLAAATSETDILLEVELTVIEEPGINAFEFVNDPQPEDGYTVGNLFIDYKTGMGSFIFTVEDDDIPEGEEIVTLALKDPYENLPDGWLISDAMSRFTVTVPANDNAARFFLNPYEDTAFTGPDTNAGEELQPIVTITEGAAGDLPHLNVIIDHIAPDGGLPLLVSVPDEYKNDISFENIDDRRSEWNSTNNNFLFLRETNIDQKANLIAGLRFLAEDDDEPEPEETFKVMLVEAPGWPSGWGSVANTYVSVFFPPFTTFSVIIPASDNTAVFAPTNPDTVVESVGTMDIAINLTNDAPAGGLPLTLTASGDIGAISFDETNPDVTTRDFSIAAGASSGQVTVYIQPDDDNDPESVTFTLTAGPGSPSGWGGVPAGETFTLNVTEPDLVIGTIAFASPNSEFTEPASENAFHFVPINVTGTLPPGGFPLMVAVDSASTADDSDYSVTPTLPNVLVGNTTVVDGVLTLNFSVFADDIPETDETLQLSIPADQTLPRGWRVVSPNTHTISIPDNDEFTASSGGPTRR